MNNKAAGYLLLELLLALGCMGLAAVMLYPGSKTLQRQYYRQQLCYTAYLLAADIRQMQQQTLFQPENYTYTLKVSDKDKHSYRIERAHKIWKRVKLDADISLTCEKAIKNLSYNENGNPTAIGGYRLEHRQLPDMYCQLTVQPVTGRVSVYER